MKYFKKLEVPKENKNEGLNNSQLMNIFNLNKGNKQLSNAERISWTIMAQLFFLLRNLEKSFIAIVTDDF